MSLPGLLRLDPTRLVPTGTRPDTRDTSAARSEAGPLRYSELPEDLREEIKSRVLDFAQMYEQSPDPDPYRVCVPHPEEIQKDCWLLKDDALALCEVNKDNERWCKHLVAGTIHVETQYWAARVPAVNFNDVVTAIRKRDAKEVDVQNGVVRSLYSGLELKRPNAVEVIIGARWWYPQYANANRPAFAIRSHLQDAVRIVAAAQLFVRAEDEYGTCDAQRKARETFDFETVYRNAETPPEHCVDTPGARRFLHPSVVYLARKLQLVDDAEHPVPDAFGVHQPIPPESHSASWWRDMAMAIIAHYGPPDVWNVAGMQDLGDTFSGVKVDAGPIAKDHLLRLPNMYNMEVSVCPNWRVGLYDVSRCIWFDGMFSNNMLFDEYIGDWDMQSAQSLDYMFWFTEFDGPVHGWRMPNLNSTSGMFSHNPVFNQPIDAWAPSMASDSSIEFDADRMFEFATAFDQPIPAFVDRIFARPRRHPGTQTFTTDMFKGASAFIRRINDNADRERYLGTGMKYIRHLDGIPIRNRQSVVGRRLINTFRYQDNVEDDADE